MAVDVVVLAAGKGKRMKSALPKVLHPLAGRPLLAHVLGTAQTLTDFPVTVVIGHGGEAVRDAFAGDDIHWVVQEQQLGTGHAVQQALKNIRESASVLVLYGDVPLIRLQTLTQLLERANEQTMALLTVTLADPAGYGRILRNAGGDILSIVEEKDADEDQKAITEVNTGVMAFPPGFLARALPLLQNDNAQGEYYLTDLVAIARSLGLGVAAVESGLPGETEGVNSRGQLHNLERQYQKNLAQSLQEQGVNVADIARFDCRGDLQCGQDCFIDINAVFEGRVKLGNGVRIGVNCYIADTEIGDNVTIKANTVIEGPVTVGSDVVVGPFARLRPGTILESGSRIGNFVETKKSRIGAGSKVNHLSYIGDTTIGEKANIGAGTITCNYDGVNKFNTDIGDGAFIGSNTSLVAPVSIGKKATVGAGSTITQNVGDEQLAVGRGRQRNIGDWQRPVKKKD